MLKYLKCNSIKHYSHLTAVRTELCKNPHIREKELHKLYADKHIRGEWYKLHN